MGERSVSRPLNLVAEATPSCLSLAGDAIVRAEGSIYEPNLPCTIFLNRVVRRSRAISPRLCGRPATGHVLSVATEVVTTVPQRLTLLTLVFLVSVPRRLYD